MYFDVSSCDVSIARAGRAGLIHLNRLKALNALTHGMCLDIEAALDRWADDPLVEIIIIDAEGEKAFCAGGDIVQLYEKGIRGNLEFGRTFWRDEYRLNEKLATYSKPIISFMQGIVMGGGVGLGCHVSHRIVGQSLKLAMPECSIGLIPDVGSNRLLARVQSGIGKYIGTTGYRMGCDDAVFAGFADYVVDENEWPALKHDLIANADPSLVARRSYTPEAGLLRQMSDEISACFADRAIPEILDTLDQDREWAKIAAEALRTSSPISILCTERALEVLGPEPGIADALALEFRFTYRATAEGDFLEGLRARIIERDHQPLWKYPDLGAVPVGLIDNLLSHLGDAELELKGSRT